MTDVSIRPGRPDEAEAIARTHIAVWRTAYRGLLPDDMLDGLRYEDRVPRWQRALNDPATLVLVAESHGEVVGFLASGRSFDDESGQTGELDAIYILDAFAGRGIGAQFAEHSDAWMREQGYTRAVLWVLPTNAGARRFYESHGWRDDAAEKTLHTHGGSVPARRYAKSLVTESYGEVATPE